MDDLEHDIRDVSLTKEAIEKSDRDLATITELSGLAQKTGNILVLSGGYATEALCGGKITRAHGDIDAHLILTGSKSAEELFEAVRELLSKENTKWILRDKKPDKVDYLEDDENKEFFNKRRVEVRLNEPHERNVEYPKRTLIDSSGKVVEIAVPDLYELVATKMLTLYQLKDGVDATKDRHPSKSDYVDLKRLLSAEGFNSEAVINHIAKSMEISNQEDAAEQASQVYKFATSSLERI